MPSARLLLALAPLLLAGCGRDATGAAAKKPTAPPVPVLVGDVVQKSMPVEVRGVGNVQAFATVAVKPQVGGTVLKVHIAAGQLVKAGELLFTIDPRPFEAALQQAEANLARNRAQREQARATVTQKQAETRQAEANLGRSQAQREMASAQERRYQELVRQELVAKDQYEQFRTNARAMDATLKGDQAALDNARAAVDAAGAAIQNAEAAVRADRAAVDSAKLQLAYCTIRSPINGRAGDVLVHAGNVVKANPDDPLLVINQVQPIYVTFAVPEPYLADVLKYRSAGELRVEAMIREQQQSVPGQLAFMNNAVDTTTGTILLKAAFPNADGALWPGQFVDIALTLTTDPDAIVVPAPAIQTGQQGSYVYVVKPDQTVESRPVTVKRVVAREVVVGSGLKPGERVVTDGQLRLSPGAKVDIKTPGAPAPPKAADPTKAAQPAKPSEPTPPAPAKAATKG